jgi:4-amino-4-deoxy-L-arabinose transferase-like glycosyltransferase
MSDPSEKPPIDPDPSAEKPAETPVAETKRDEAAPAPEAPATKPETGAFAEGVSVRDPEPLRPPDPALDPDREGSQGHPFLPAKAKARDWILSLVGVGGLAVLMSLKGHQRFGVIIGVLLTFVAVLGLFGLLGDSPLDLRGDEVTDDDTVAPRKPWWKREGAWVVLFGMGLYYPRAGSYGLWDPWETHYSEVAREILSRDDWITTWWGQEGWFMSKPVLIFWMSALGMGTGTAFGLRIAPDSGPQFQEWCIRLPIATLAIAALYALYRAVASAWGKRAGLLVAIVLGTMPHWFFLAHQAMTDMPFVAPLVIAIAMLMYAVTVGDRVAVPKVFHVFGRPVRFSLWHHAVGIFLTVSLPQIVYLVTRPMVTTCPADARQYQCQEMLRLNRIGNIQLPVETYYYGSAGNSAETLNASVPGSPAWERLANVVPFFPSVVQGVLWTLLGALALWLLRKARAQRDLYFTLFYFWCAISTMGKGPAGLAIPVAIAGLHLITSGDWKLLRQSRLLTGLLVFAVTGMPWYIAITGRLGNEFFDRFVVHDIINRTVVGVHGDTGSVRYFIWQLGYAMFPWVGLVPVALMGWRQIVPTTATAAQKTIARIGVLWFMIAFFLFSAMITKFHHYIFPAVPGAAVMVGLLLDRMLGSSSLARARNPVGSIAALGAGLLSLVVGIANFFGSPRGIIPFAANGALPAGSRALGYALLGVGPVLVFLSWYLSRPEVSVESEERAESLDVNADGTAALPPPGANLTGFSRIMAYFTEPDSAQLGTAATGLAKDDKRYGMVSYGAMAVAAAGVVAFVARDLGYSGSTRPPGYQRLLQLFTYQYERQWPTLSLDYHPILIGFGVVAVVVMAAVAVHAWRAHAVRALAVTATLFAVWALDYYMVDISQHWSQRTLFERYYAMRHARDPGDLREGEDARYTHDPMGAFQMNWKGENFYTGGHCAMLDCGDLPFCRDPNNHIRNWMEIHRGQRAFFVTERTHGGSVIAHVRSTGGEAHEVTNEWDQNKFVLVEARIGQNFSRR